MQPFVIKILSDLICVSNLLYLVFDTNKFIMTKMIFFSETLQGENFFLDFRDFIFSINTSYKRF